MGYLFVMMFSSLSSLMSTNQQVIGRNNDYMDLNIRLTIDVIKAANTIKLFPDIVKP